MLQILLARKI